MLSLLALVTAENNTFLTSTKCFPKLLRILIRMMESSMPIPQVFVAFFSYLFLGRRYRATQLLGIGCSIAGMILCGVAESLEVEDGMERESGQVRQRFEGNESELHDLNQRDAHGSNSNGSRTSSGIGNAAATDTDHFSAKESILPVLFGICCVAISQIFESYRRILEEKMMKRAQIRIEVDGQGNVERNTQGKAEENTQVNPQVNPKANPQVRGTQLRIQKTYSASLPVEVCCLLQGVIGTMIMLVFVFPLVYMIPGGDPISEDSNGALNHNVNDHSKRNDSLSNLESRGANDNINPHPILTGTSSDNGDSGSYESFPDTLTLLLNSPFLSLLITIRIMISALSNFCGMKVTATLSSVHRGLADAFRTVIAWGICVVWHYSVDPRSSFSDFGERLTRFSWIQGVAFLLCVAGQLLYGGVTGVGGTKKGE
jgi:hypothetical protein